MFPGFSRGENSWLETILVPFTLAHIFQTKSKWRISQMSRQQQRFYWFRYRDGTNNGEPFFFK